MAIELMARIMSQPRDVLDSSEKLVLIVMADRCDQDGVLWYSVSTICHLTSFTRKAIQRIFVRLEGKGLLSRMHRSQRSNYYRINVDRLPMVSLVKGKGEVSLRDMIEAEPDLFGMVKVVGDLGTPTVGEGDRGTPPGRPSDAFGGVLGTPDSLTDPSIDSLQSNAGEGIEDLVIRLWSELADKHKPLPPAPPLSDKRKRAIELRTADLKSIIGAASPEAGWIRVFEVIGRSRLLTGQKTDWAPTLDWVLGPKNFEKITGGNYGQGNDAIGAVAIAGGDRSAVAAGSDARLAVSQARERQRKQAVGAR